MPTWQPWNHSLDCPCIPWSICSILQATDHSCWFPTYTPSSCFGLGHTPYWHQRHRIQGLRIIFRRIWSILYIIAIPTATMEYLVQFPLRNGLGLTRLAFSSRLTELLIFNRRINHIHWPAIRGIDLALIYLGSQYGSLPSFSRIGYPRGWWPGESQSYPFKWLSLGPQENKLSNASGLLSTRPLSLPKFFIWVWDSSWECYHLRIWFSYSCLTVNRRAPTMLWHQA